MKKFFLLILCVALLLSVFGCGESNNNGTQASSTTLSTTTQIDVTATSTTTQPSTTIQEFTSTTTETATQTTTHQPKWVQYEIGVYYSGVKDWVVDGDTIHVLFSMPNRYMAINSCTGKVLRDVYLPGEASEIHLYGDELWVLYSRLNVINIYNKNFELKRQLSFDSRLGSFDLYGDYIIYSTYDQHCRVYRLNMKTNEIKSFVCPNYSFYEPDILVDTKNGDVYIGESNNRDKAGKLYRYDVETMTLKSMAQVRNIVYVNGERRMFLCNDALYWGHFKIELKDFDKDLDYYCYKGSNHKDFHAYSDVNYVSGMLFANERYVVTTKGFFDAKTDELIAQAGTQCGKSAAAVTQSGNIMYITKGVIYIAAYI